MQGRAATIWAAGLWLGVLCAASTVRAQEAADHESASEERDDDPMGSVGLVLKAGYLYYGAIDYEYVTPDIPGLVAEAPAQPSRGEPTVSLALQLGDGFGLGWDFETYLMFERDLVVGGYTGPAFRFHIKRLYVSIGAGLRLGVLTTDALDVGLDVYGRIPITLTYYLADHLGLVFEFGFGVGGTGIKEKNPNIDISGVSTDQLAQAGHFVENVSFLWGTTGTFDGSIGLRFP